MAQSVGEVARPDRQQTEEHPAARASPFAAKGGLIAGIVAAVAASLCCVGPLVLLMLGIGGAWIGHLAALSPWRPVFIALTVFFLGLTFRRLYFRPAVCAVGTACTDARALKRQRFIFWTVSVLLLGLIAVPWLAPLFD